MCGIFFIKKDENNSLNLIQEEFNKSKNRGGIPPDDTRFLEIGEYYMGFHRLSINGLDNTSNQPFFRNNIYVICNGEIYNYKELYSHIGIKQMTNSDCEIILDLYELYPVEYFINLLDGVFSFIIYDTRKNIIVAARDPFGVRPLFYSEDYNCFSSELKQINNLTIKNINQFPPGHFIIKTFEKTYMYRYHNISQFLFTIL